MNQCLDAVLSAQPALLRVGPARALLGLNEKTLLHAGPPLLDPCKPPAVLLSTAVLLCLHEGWARDMQEAESMVRTGRVTLEPAQAHACVVPLAHMVSASTPLLEVGDGYSPSVFAPVSAVLGADARMGTRDAAVLPRLEVRDQSVGPGLARILARYGPLPLLGLAAQGLAGGDDLHSRTANANAALVDWLQASGAGALAEDVAATPLFFLTLWMAACAFILRAAEAYDDMPTLVTRAGGNAESFGICLAAEPLRWITQPAQAPTGKFFQIAASGFAVSPAVGDSAVIDVLGLGGQTLATAPEPLAAFLAYLPPDYADISSKLMTHMHPVLGRRVGLDARQVAVHQTAPLIALAMIAADGQGGLLGRGVYTPPLCLFQS